MSVDGIKIGDKLEIHCYKHPSLTVFNLKQM